MSNQNFMEELPPLTEREVNEMIQDQQEYMSDLVEMESHFAEREAAEKEG